MTRIITKQELGAKVGRDSRGRFLRIPGRVEVYRITSADICAICTKPMDISFTGYAHLHCIRAAIRYRASKLSP